MAALDLWIYGIIGDEFGGLDSRTIVEQIRAHDPGEPIVVHINSPGGVAMEGTAIANALERHGGDVRADIEGEALSAATLVAMGARHRRIATNGVFMVHNPWYVVAGDEHELRKAADALAKYTASAIDTYARVTGLKTAVVRQLMADETFMTPKEAKTYGFVTEVVEPREFGDAIAKAPRVSMAAAPGAKPVPRVAAAFAEHIEAKTPDWARQARRDCRMSLASVQRFAALARRSQASASPS